jgi:hypothetical protein
VPELPAPIDEIIMKGLARDPSQRYQTAREMALDIEACVPAIRPSQISAWVEHVAGETLAARAAALAAIEGSDAGDDAMPTQSTPRPQTEAPPRAHTHVSRRDGSGDGPSSAPSAGPPPSTGEWASGDGEPVGITICTTLSFARINETLFLYYRVAEGPSDRDWQLWLDRLKVLDFRSLVISSSTEAGPNAKQRRQLGDVWNSSSGPRPRVARLTNSAPVRSSYTALGWLMTDMPMQVFTPDQLADALQWVNSSASPVAASSLLFLLATAPVSGEWRRESG